MQHYRILSALLLYPEPELVAALPEMEAGLDARPGMRAALRPLLACSSISTASRATAARPWST